VYRGCEGKALYSLGSNAKLNVWSAPNFHGFNHTKLHRYAWDRVARRFLNLSECGDKQNKKAKPCWPTLIALSVISHSIIFALSAHINNYLRFPELYSRFVTFLQRFMYALFSWIGFMGWTHFTATKDLEFTQLLTEMSTRSRKIMFLGSRARSVGRADNFTAICEPTV
jgi:hypothetical protein